MKKIGLIALFLIVLSSVSAPALAQVGSCPLPPLGHPISFCKFDITQDQNDNIAHNVVRAMMKMTEQFSVVMMGQVFSVGQFFDAKEQMDAYRTLDQLKARAHKDYHPSEQLCQVGSYVRSVALSAQEAQLNTAGIQKVLLDYATNRDGAISQNGARDATRSRVDQVKSLYCHPQDNNGVMSGFCRAGNPERINRDVSIGATLMSPRTLEIDFKTPAVTPDEEDILALAKNLYWPEALPSPKGGVEEKPIEILRARQLIAKNALAHQSLAYLAGMKAEVEGLEAQSGTAFMKAMMADFGLEPADIDKLMGEKPSLYAQMEFLTSTMYQNPDFFTNLYDKPANVQRMSVALEAMQLMQQRERYKAQLRREMLASQLLEDAIVEAVPERFY